jgi:elongator complex protein 6
VRFLCEAFSQDPVTGHERIAQEEKEDVAVVLVSWMRDWDFWKNEARKGGGLDLERLKRDKRLAFVDGLSKLCLPENSQDKIPTGLNTLTRPQQPSAVQTGRIQQTALPSRGPPGRSNPGATPSTSSTALNTTPTRAAGITTAAASQTSASGQFYMTSPDLKHFQDTVETAIQHVQSLSPSKSLLILDTPSLLLATNPTISASSLAASLLQLHTHTSHILVHAPADEALISLSHPPQPLEIDAHNFLVKVAHMSTRILSCRVLDTGVARDISGVLRVTENNVGEELELKQREDGNMEKHGRELLYLVKGDGSVKIFERGAGEA